MYYLLTAVFHTGVSQLLSFFVFSFKISSGRLQSVRCLSVFLGRPFGSGLSQSCGCPLNGCPFSALMGPLWTPANTTAIIAGKASGDLACYCPGQLERKKALTMTMNERKIETRGETFLIPYAVKEPSLLSVAWISTVYWFLIASSWPLTPPHDVRLYGLEIMELRKMRD